MTVVVVVALLLFCCGSELAAVTVAVFLDPGDVRAARGVDVHLEDIRQSAGRTGDRGAEEPERADPASARSVAVDGIGIEQDLLGRDRGRCVACMRATGVTRDGSCDLREADVPDARRLIWLERCRAVVGGVDDPGRPCGQPWEEERARRLVD